MIGRVCLLEVFLAFGAVFVKQEVYIRVNEFITYSCLADPRGIVIRPLRDTERYALSLFV